ncbi:ATP-binding protein [Actinacidiphila acidipaludis]|uniref:histidine kinase n=1 Tax=Actinacidiphila acidipaludis TaxID=2873382 RepID=A0ABS7QH65_9ACTN|nr:ATP-binding protein [Streptomyces acidipaludis]MBY8882516.1 ATP-binding protein [Streptomyces acidipaludis]
MIEIPDVVLGCLSAGTLAALVLGGGLWRSRRRGARQSAELTALNAALDGAREEADAARAQRDAARAESAAARAETLTAEALTAEVAHLARQRVPATATHAAHPHVRVPGPLDDAVAGTPLGDALDEVQAAVLTATAQERKRVDAAARAGMRGATRDIQAGLYRLQDVLRGLQEKYDDPELAQVLFALDHENEQSLRRAQVTAVVCGAWVGLAREESHLVEAVTGGQSRLVGYHRVKVHHHLEPGTALVSHAVEPVAIIVAELLDNALRHSAPDTDVVVNLERVPSGVAVTVDDYGVGMAADERARAQRMVAGTEAILLSELGDPPRMGLAAIGQLTRRFDLSVDLSSPSPYGGVRAVLLIRNHLLSHIDPVEQPPAASTPRSTRTAAAPAAAATPVNGHSHASSAADPTAPDAGARTHGTARPAGSAPASVPASGTRGAGTGPVEDAGARSTATAGTEPSTAATPDADPRDTAGTGDPLGSGDPNDPGPHDSGNPDEDTLPQRRRRARGRATAATATAPPARTPEESAAALGALQAGTAAARSEADSEGNDPR